MNKIDTRLPRYQILRDAIAAKINGHDWKPDDLIPSEAELAAEHGIAVGTVRKAIDILVADGFLERQQGRGTFVRRARFNSSLFRFFRFQSNSGERQVPESRILRRKRRKATSAVASALGITEGEEVLFLTRLRLIGGVPLLTEDIWLPLALFTSLVELPKDEFGDLLYPLYEDRCGQVVVTAEETLTIEAAQPLIAQLLQREAGSPLIVIERTAFDLERRPIEWRRSRGPADLFRYRVEIR